MSFKAGEIVHNNIGTEVRWVIMADKGSHYLYDYEFIRGTDPLREKKLYVEKYYNSYTDIFCEET